MLGFGATYAERTAELPGDELIASSRSGYTQAYTIDAPPDDVWPWLVRVGYARAGWYNLDWINRLASPDGFSQGERSARRIIPELQKVEPGDEIGIVPQMAMQVVEAIPGRLLLAGDPTDLRAELNAVGLFDLSDAAAGRTRMVVWFASVFPDGPGARILNGFVNEIGGAIIEQPAMMHGLARRAEGRLSPPNPGISLPRRPLHESRDLVGELALDVVDLALGEVALERREYLGDQLARGGVPVEPRLAHVFLERFDPALEVLDGPDAVHVFAVAPLIDVEPLQEHGQLRNDVQILRDRDPVAQRVHDGPQQDAGLILAVGVAQVGGELVQEFVALSGVVVEVQSHWILPCVIVPSPYSGTTAR